MQAAGNYCLRIFTPQLGQSHNRIPSGTVSKTPPLSTPEMPVLLPTIDRKLDMTARSHLLSCQRAHDHERGGQQTGQQQERMHVRGADEYKARWRPVLEPA